MSRHRETALRPGQDVLEVVGRVLWQKRRECGDEIILRGYLAPVPHVALEVWREGKCHSVKLAVPELGEVAAALLAAVRPLVRERSEGAS